MKKIIAVDLRCLNYPFFTGVNVYAIHFLKCLQQAKKSGNLYIIGVGIKDSNLKKLYEQFDFIVSLFDKTISLNTYLKRPEEISTKLLELEMIIKSRLKNSLINNNIITYDYLILLQPKIIQKNFQTKIITIIHDIFSILDNSNSLLQKIIYNRGNLTLILDSSYKIVTNSMSTSNDINKEFGNLAKINLVYPGEPNLQDMSNKNDKIIMESDTDISKCDYILAISGIENRKNWYNLVLAHHMANQENMHRETKLMLSGIVVNTTYYKKILRIIRERGIKNIEWCISPDEHVKNQLIKNCLFLAYPSVYEGFGFPILEAKKNNKDILTSKCSSMTEIGKNTCFYINPFDVKNIKNGIIVMEKEYVNKNISKEKILNDKLVWHSLYEYLYKL